MQVYADNAATTRMHQTAIDTMTYHLNNTFGNPSSLYTIGQQAKEVLETARADMAACFGAQPREIYFTSGGSEADNQAITSAAYLGARKGKKHIISTAFEHHAILHTLKKLEKEEKDHASFQKLFTGAASVVGFILLLFTVGAFRRSNG